MSNNKTNIVFYYYLNNQLGGGNKNKWTSFIHNGVMFAPKYKPHGIPIKYKNKEIKLNPEQEEYATLYAKYINTDYIKNKTFNKNFFKSWKPLVKNLGIDTLEDCDFTSIYNHLLDEKEQKLKMTKEEKERIKLEQKKEEEKYKIAYLDNKQEEVGNFKIEPPGIFIGRGCHPKLGTVKKRILPKDVTLNISKDAEIPNGKNFWKKVIHNKQNEWLASWKDDITGKTKYVWLSNKSSFKSQSDEEKFNKARKLNKKIDKIRDINNNNLTNDNIKIRQLSTSLYLIDTLALRVGNEKNDDEADTVGVTSLRYEHITLLENNNIKLDFLGKDSVRYTKQFEVPSLVYKNISDFLKEKKKGDDLFDKIRSIDLNEYIKEFSENLTAKVFRTFNASNTFQKELNNITRKYKNYDKNDKESIVMSEFNKASAKIAVLCNHQKNISKNFGENIKKIEDKIKEIKLKINKLEDEYKNEKKEKKSKIKEKIEKLKERKNKERIKKELKIEMKNISTTTSRDNYIDPRITVAFLKTHNIDFSRAFNENTLNKFRWAIDTDKDWQF